MNRSKGETALARRVAAGDREAWEQLLAQHYRRVHDLHRLATADTEAATSLADATFQEAAREISAFLRDDEPFAHWIAALSRDIAHRYLSEDDWRATPWAQGQEILSDPPLAEPLTSEELHAGEEIAPEVLERALSGLSLGHRLLTRLLFVEGLGSGRLAGLLSASSMFVRSFVYGLLDQLGSLETLEHDGSECEAGLTLALRTLEQHLDQRAIRDLLLENSDCQGCQTLIFRVLRLSGSLAREAGPAVVPDPGSVQALARLVEPAPAATGSPGQAAASEERPPVARIIPLRTRPQVRNRDRRVGHWVLAALFLLAFMGGTWKLVDDGRIRGRPVPLAITPEETPSGDETRGPVAYYSGRTQRKQLLQGGQTLHASPLGATAVTFISGPRLVLTAGSSMTGRARSIELHRGRSLIFLESLKPGAGFDVLAGRARLSARSGSLAVTTQPGQGTVLAIKGGSAQVALPGGEQVTLDPFQQLRIGPDGSFQVEDAPSTAFSEAGPPDLPGAGDPGGMTAAGADLGAGSTGSGTRPTLLGRYNPGRAGHGQGSTGFGVGSREPGQGAPETGGTPGRDSPPDNGIMIPGESPRPGTVRGFRDAF